MLKRMRRHLGIGAAWLGATALSVFIASAAVAGIRDRVVDAPVALGAPTSTTAAVVDTTATTSSTTTSATDEPTTTTTAPEVTETTAGSTTETTVTTTTSTTVPPATTTTTTTEPPPTTTTAPASTTTVSLIGGTVTIGYDSTQVWVISVSTAAGFIPEIEKEGPGDSIEVEFYSESHKSELSAKIENGELKIEKDEEPRDEEGD